MNHVELTGPGKPRRGKSSSGNVRGHQTEKDRPRSHAVRGGLIMRQRLPIRGCIPKAVDLNTLHNLAVEPAIRRGKNLGLHPLRA